MADIQELVLLISETQQFFKQQAQRQVNTALTLRNWLFGFYIAEYELNGSDRAVYGEKIYKEIAFRSKHVSGLSERNLYLFKSFYLAYPNILQSVTAKLYLKEIQHVGILQTLSAKLEGVKYQAIETTNSDDDTKIFQSVTGKSQIDVDKLINQLSFTHIIELLKAETPLKRSFYEMEAIKNCWSVRELQRAMNSLLFERTGLSTNKQAVLDKQNDKERLLPEDLFRDPYMLEFLELKEEAEYSESDVEQAIIDQLQSFLLEMGKGFCFEARQKRITFDNTHYHIDLVFYHRILRCNVLIDLKLGVFTHADAGQMNVYLNYYKEDEMQEGDNLPIGIILCASKNENLVKYATTGLAQRVFVNKYMLNLPREDELRKIIEVEQQKMEFRGRNL